MKCMEKKMDKVLKLGIPKGSLEKATTDLFAKAGWVIKTSSRNYFPTVDDPHLSCAIIRAQEMARYVQDGVLDAGLTGHDWVVETGADVHEVAELVFSKVSRRPVRWVLCVPENSPVKTVRDLEGKRIATGSTDKAARVYQAADAGDYQTGIGRLNKMLGVETCDQLPDRWTSSRSSRRR